MATTKKKKSSRSRRRAGATTPKDYWAYRSRPLRFGEERFRATVINPLPHGNKSVRATDQVADFSWDDTSSELTGNLTFQQLPVHINISQRTKIRMDWQPNVGGKWDRLFTMKASAPERTMSTEQLALDLTTALSTARDSRDDYRFKRDKRHPRGWTCDQIAEFVCKKVGIKVRNLARGTHRITNLVKKDADPIDLIVLAYRAERRATGRRFFMTWDGEMSVNPLKRSEHLLDLSGAIIDATYKNEQQDEFATSLTVRGTVKAKTGKHKRRKFHVKVTSDAGVRRFGYVHRTVTDDHAHTEAEARKYGKRMLAKAMKPKQTLQVQMPLMPTVRRGDAFKVHWASEGLTQIVFVSAASHNVAPGSMQSTLTATFTDPFIDTKGDRDAKRRQEKARKRKREPAEKKAPSGPTGRRGSRRRGAH